MTDIQQIIDYYGNLLIVQYHDKPKAQATIAAVVEAMLANGVFFDVLNGYNIDTAVGVQLDVLAKYIGVDRFYTRQILDGYFSFSSYDETPYDYEHGIGFSTYADYDTKDGKWLSYQDVINTQLTLSDDDFRTILKLKIIQNNSNHSRKSIDDSMFAFFGNTVVPSSDGNMMMTYTVLGELTSIVAVAIQKQVLPVPIGVGLSITISTDTIITTDDGRFITDNSNNFITIG